MRPPRRRSAIERREFRNLTSEFASRFGGSEGGQPTRLGGWLVGRLGIGPVCVAIGYRDGYFANRFLQKVDARSIEETAEWSMRYKRAWLRINADFVSGPKAEAFVLAVDEDDDAESLGDLWRAVMATYDWAEVTHWGPGSPVGDWRLERLQLLFLATRIVDGTRGSHAAFSYLMGSEPRTATSPLLSIRLGGREEAEGVLRNAYTHVVEMGVPDGFEPAEELRSR